VQVLRQPPRTASKYVSRISFPIGPTSPEPSGPVVDLDHRGDLDAGAAQEHLVGDVQLRPVDRADLDGDRSFSSISKIALRVTPSRMSSFTGGVRTTPSRTTKRFAAEASFTWPSAVRTIASS
jgi:hypothetical protein